MLKEEDKKKLTNCFFKLKEFIKAEFGGFSKKEKVIYLIIVAVVVVLAYIKKSSLISIISAICGISYTILAGKGKVFCYFIGMIGTFCYCYLSYHNSFYGNLMLYGFYYFPMELVGIFKWLKHYRKDKKGIIKTKLSKKERLIFFPATFLVSIAAVFILGKFNSSNPVFDAFSVVFSILAQFLTIKRCIEQWYIWSFVNVLSCLMWIIAYIKGADCFPLILMWAIYFFLGLHFLHSWKKELNNLD